MPGIVHHFTNKQWSRLGRDLKTVQDAWEDYKYGGTGVHCAELVERYDDLKYILRLPKPDVIACADFYSLDSHLFGVFTCVEWRDLVEDWRGEDAKE